MIEFGLFMLGILLGAALIASCVVWILRHPENYWPRR